MPSRMGQRNFSRTVAALLCAVISACASSRAAQQTSSDPPAAAQAGSQQGIYLVFPFENAGASPRLDWLGEGLEELTIHRLSPASQQVYTPPGPLTNLAPSALPAPPKLT